MCGFTGCFSFKSINPQDIEEGNKIAVCRGPDNQKNISGYVTEKIIDSLF